jgi:RAB6A-GEF complex partner protein 1
MYWPIGAPRIYAASNKKAPKRQIIHSDDDAENHGNFARRGSRASASRSSPHTAQDEDETASELVPPSTPLTTGVGPVEHEAQRRLSTRSAVNPEDDLEDRIVQAEKSPILSLKISRSGHLFAVITSTSLTIWQTKVMYAIPCIIKALTANSRLLYWQW